MKKKLLIIEEDPDIREIVSFVLIKAGYSVVATSPDNTQLEKHRPDLIILDDRLKHDTRNLLCKKLKALPEIKEIPVILFSTDMQIEKLAEICEADDYLSKPFDLEDLLLKVGHFFSDQSVTA